MKPFKNQNPYNTNQWKTCSKKHSPLFGRKQKEQRLITSTHTNHGENDKNMDPNDQAEARLLKATKYRWRGGTNACYEIQCKDGKVLFCLWSQFHAQTVLLLCKRIQKLTKQKIPHQVMPGFYFRFQFILYSLRISPLFE